MCRSQLSLELSLGIVFFVNIVLAAAMLIYIATGVNTDIFVWVKDYVASLKEDDSAVNSTVGWSMHSCRASETFVCDQQCNDCDAQQLIQLHPNPVPDLLMHADTVGIQEQACSGQACCAQTDKTRHVVRSQTVTKHAKHGRTQPTECTGVLRMAVSNCQPLYQAASSVQLQSLHTKLAVVP